MMKLSKLIKEIRLISKEEDPEIRIVDDGGFLDIDEVLHRNSTFYPTPPDLAKRMVDRIDLSKKAAWKMNVLEPSAGAGDLIKALNEDRDHSEFREIKAIEVDQNFRSILRGKGIKVIDSDFLAYSGPDKFDLIIANPPFDNGDKHLMKAIEILYRGQIIFLLNAETLRNPCTNTRKELVRKLKELCADIEYIKDAFLDAERKTKVEVALIDIRVDRKVEEDLFKGVKDAKPIDEEVSDKNEVSNRHMRIREMVADYNEIVKFGIDTTFGYFQNYPKVGKYIGLNKEAKDNSYSSEDLTEMMQSTLNEFLSEVRKDFWRKTFELPEVRKRMTKARMEEFEHALNARSIMDFTENNIRQFVLNLIEGYEDALMKSVLALFDKFTRHAYYGNKPNEENIHYFNGWKTNDAFKVKKKVIIPIYPSYGNAFRGWSGDWDLDYGAARELDDIDTVMNYFDGMSDYQSISYKVNFMFKHSHSNSKNRGIESTYFKTSVFKKGTVHLTFRDEGVLRRFNVAACKGKGWLPQNYGDEAYGRMSLEERNVVDSFEGKKSYDVNLRQPLFAKKSLLQITG